MNILDFTYSKNLILPSVCQLFWATVNKSLKKSLKSTRIRQNDRLQVIHLIYFTFSGAF
jgi:hypothetical protein